ncbi:radical SAM protein [Methanocaldococcus indicus]|uniref:radical SAM protein n=1 Tax=Methanocaldococcus indicus TaxID=213231 RepID=UPI003C6CDCEF
MRALILDGYTDEPAGLGVPPYLGVYPRYAYGVLDKFNVETDYTTIDKFREKPLNLERYDLIICISGFHTPGKYLSANPATLKELASIVYKSNAIKVLGGPVATKFGSSFVGGELKKEEKYKEIFDVVVEGDLEAVLYDLLNENLNVEKVDTERFRSYEELREFAIRGAKIVKKHPLYPNIIVELESYRGCARAITGGCSFCVEPRRFKLPEFRDERDIYEEAKALSLEGIKYFRVGRQPCIYSYKAFDIGKEEVPKPNVDAIEKLFKSLSSLNPKVLHIDNVNPAVIARYKEESMEITKILVKYCTSGNVAAFGVESFDKKVIKANNLGFEPEEILEAVKILNEIGGERGETGLPNLLPGINLLFGLKGESKRTFKINYEYLKKIYDEGYMLRRINIRQVVPFYGTDICEKDIKKAEKRKKLFLWFKEKIREEIDNKMLKRVVPKGTILKDVLIEKKDKNLYFGRQLGSYPILVGIKGNVNIGEFVDVKVVDYGYRSITGVPIKN